MDYRVEIKTSARKELLGLPVNARRRVNAAILALADDPRPQGCKKLHGVDDVYRVRVGDYRVIYIIHDDIVLVVVVRVRHRRDAYR